MVKKIDFLRKEAAFVHKTLKEKKQNCYFQAAVFYYIIFLLSLFFFFTLIKKGEGDYDGLPFSDSRASYKSHEISIFFLL